MWFAVNFKAILGVKKTSRVTEIQTCDLQASGCVKLNYKCEVRQYEQQMTTILNEYIWDLKKRFYLDLG